MYSDQPVIPVRRLHNYVYCPRLMYFQFVENVFVYNSDVAEGEGVHRRVDVPTPTEFPESLLLDPHETLRSLALENQELGISGVIDLLKKQEDGSWIIFDYKRGSPITAPDGSKKAKEADAFQVMAYAWLAEQNGYRISGGKVYYAESQTFIPIDLAQAETRLRQTVAEVREIIAGPLPPSLESDNRCLFCSLYPVCLPDESRYWKRQGKGGAAVRPPQAEDDPGEVLIVQNPRAWLSKKGDTITVSVEGQTVSSHPLHALRSIFLYGVAQLSTQLIQTCLAEGIQVAFLSPAGKFLGRLDTLSITGLDSRYGQYKISMREAAAVKIAHTMIRAKISNQRTLLMRNAKNREPKVLTALASLKKEVMQSHDRTALMGIEGRAAALYFENFSSMLTSPTMAALFHGRNRRPPRDPVNAMLSLGYSVLASEITGICAAVGLDPACGILHAPRFGRPALALDVMEEFRPLIVDSVVISLVNKGYVTEDDFIFTSQGCSLRKSGHQAFWSAYAKRMAEELIHPTFHYRMSYRRLLEIQVRQLWRIFRGDQTSYHPIITR